MTGFRARMTKLKERLKGLGKKISQQVNEAVAAARANQTVTIRECLDTLSPYMSGEVMIWWI